MPLTDAHNTKHTADKWAKVHLSRLKSTIDLLKQSNEVKSTESGRRFQRLINLSLKKEERVELLKAIKY